MTILEIILAVSFGLFVVFAILVGIGAAVERGNFLKRAKVAGRIAKSAEATARMWRRHLDEQSQARRELDQGVGRAVCRIIGAHSEEHCLRRGTDPDSYYPGQGKEHAFIAQGMLRALNILEEETGRYKEEKEAPSPAYLSALTRRNIVRQSTEADRQRRQFVADQKREAEARVGAPAHGPVTDPCVVCGGHACTYRWGQYISTWSSETNDRVTHVTIRWQDFDQRFDVGWLSLCHHHALALDEHDNVTHMSKGYHCG